MSFGGHLNVFRLLLVFLVSNLRISCQVWGQEDLSPMLLSNSFIALALYLGHWSILYLYMEWGTGLFLFLSCDCAIVPALVVEMFPPWIVVAPLSKISCLQMFGFISRLSVLFCWSLCLSLHLYQPHYFDYCSFVLSFEIGKYEFTEFFFSFSIFTFSRPLAVP